MTLATTVKQIFSTQWKDFTIVNQEIYDTQIDVTEISSSDTVRDVVLGLLKYNVADGVGYGSSNSDVGQTEQQAYDDWIIKWVKNTKQTLQTIKNYGLLRITQNQFDALCMYNWFFGNISTVRGPQESYDLKHAIVARDWDTVANMIKNSVVKRIYCRKIATLLRLAQYEKPVSRINLRTQGINQMRALNQIELATMDSKKLKRIRFAYYAETRNFLAFTPESIKRDISNRYNETLIEQTFVYSGENVFEIQKNPSMYPVEKLQVLLNGDVLQNYFDFKIEGRTLTVLKDMNNNDIISTTIRI